jgi:3-hydroxyacyl-[acyl-carrier-protein] dehydratase
LRETLKRCSPETVAAACAFRRDGDPAHLPAIVRGLIARYTEPARRPQLAQPAADQLHLVEDLALDSLTLMEIVMLAEDVFPVAIANEELRHLRTVGDVQRFIAARLRGEPPPCSPAQHLTTTIARAAAAADPGGG